MIRSFKHSGLEKFYNTDSKAGIIPAHAKRLSDQLSPGCSNEARRPGQIWMEAAPTDWQTGRPLVNLGKWQLALTFRFTGVDVEIVDDQDYH